MLSKVFCHSGCFLFKDSALSHFFLLLALRHGIFVKKSFLVYLLGKKIIQEEHREKSLNGRYAFFPCIPHLFLQEKRIFVDFKIR